MSFKLNNIKTMLSFNGGLSSKNHVEQLCTAVNFNLRSSLRQREMSKLNQINVLFFFPSHFRNNLSSETWSSELRSRRFASMTPREAIQSTFSTCFYRHVTCNVSPTRSKSRRHDGLSILVIILVTKNIRQCIRSMLLSDAIARAIQGRTKSTNGNYKKKGEVMEEQPLCRPFIVDASPAIHRTASPPRKIRVFESSSGNWRECAQRVS